MPKKVIQGRLVVIVTQHVKIAVNVVPEQGCQTDVYLSTCTKMGQHRKHKQPLKNDARGAKHCYRAVVKIVCMACAHCGWQQAYACIFGAVISHQGGLYALNST